MIKLLRVGALVLAGCSPPKPPVLTLPKTPKVQCNARTTLRAQVERALVGSSVEWSVSGTTGASVEPVRGFAATYHASTRPGHDTITGKLFEPGRKNASASATIEVEIECTPECAEKDFYCVTFLKVPEAGSGDPKVQGELWGSVRGGNPGNSRILIYVWKGTSWVLQSNGSQLARMPRANGTFTAQITRGEKIAILVTAPKHRPVPELTELPQPGGTVRRVAEVAAPQATGSASH